MVSTKHGRAVRDSGLRSSFQGKQTEFVLEYLIRVMDLELFIRVMNNCDRTKPREWTVRMNAVQETRGYSLMDEMI